MMKGKTELTLSHLEVRNQTEVKDGKFIKIELKIYSSCSFGDDSFRL